MDRVGRGKGGVQWRSPHAVVWVGAEMDFLDDFGGTDIHDLLRRTEDPLFLQVRPPQAFRLRND